MCIRDRAGSLGDAMASAEASIKNMEQTDALQNQIDAGKVKSFNLQRDREEAEAVSYTHLARTMERICYDRQISRQ